MSHHQIPSVEDITKAHARIKPFIHHTPLLTSRSIDQIAGANIYFKCENFQKIGAFKIRGAMNTILQLSEEEKAKGVATHSSGNHAQAIAFGAKMMGIPAYIVMPENAPEVKRKAVQGYGAEVIICAPNLQARETTLEAVVARTGATFIHPYNDYRVIAGQGTAAVEVLQEQEVDILLAPVGGGGLLSGTALAANYFSPNTTVIAGEPKGADDAFRSVEAGHLIPMTQPKTIADGLLTSLGDKTFPIIQKYVEEIITVEDHEIIAAMRLIWERMKIIIEPSCAVPLAAVMKQKVKFAEKNIGIILTGGNVDLGKLPF